MMNRTSRSVGEPLVISPVDTLPRSETKLLRVETNGCWFWKGAGGTEGLGRIGPRPSDPLVHRHLYELLVGPVPDGRRLNMRCLNILCVNPHHADLVRDTLGEVGDAEVELDVSVAAELVTDLCRKGHQFSPANTYTSKQGRRACRTCRRERDSRRQQE